MHRAFNVASLAVAVVAFIVIFVAQKDQPTPGLIDLGAQNVSYSNTSLTIFIQLLLYSQKVGTAHFALGIAVMALQILNVIRSGFALSLSLTPSLPHTHSPSLPSADASRAANGENTHIP